MNKNLKLNPRLFSEDVELVSMRDGFGEGLVRVGKRNKKVVAVSADLLESTRLDWFQAKFPQRTFEVGVAEQNLAGVAAGLALGGKLPFMASYAVFSPGRNWDQIRVSICYSQLNVKIVGSHAGLSVGLDGATHQALEDLALMRVLPNMTVLAPCDAIEAGALTLAAADWPGPVYLRLARPATPVILTPRYRPQIGQGGMVRPGQDVTIIACGLILFEALWAAKILSETEKIEARVINLSTLKPIDQELIIRAAGETGAIVTAEEHQIHAGLAGAVAEVLSQKEPVPLECVAVADTFGESGSANDLAIKYGLSRDNVLQAVLKVLKRKK